MDRQVEIMAQKYYYKAFLFTNGHKGRELPIQMPLFLEDKLNETLSTGQITAILDDVKSFPPKTKIKIELYTDDPTITTNLIPMRTWDYVIEDDQVEEWQGV
jgi:hypothetical protein